MTIESLEPESRRIDIQHYWNDWFDIANETRRALQDDPHIWAMHNKLELLGLSVAKILGIEGPAAFFNRDLTEIKHRSLEELNYDEELYNEYESIRVEANEILQQLKELKSKYPTKVVSFQDLEPQTILDIPESQKANVMESFEKLRTLMHKIGNLLYGKDIGFL